MTMQRAVMLFGLLSTSLSMAGCVNGERPRISSIYGDPVSQAPIPTTSAPAPVIAGSSTHIEQSTDIYTSPGTTLYFGPAYPEARYRHPSYDPYRGSYDRRIYPDERDPRFAPRLPPGQPRYAYPSDGVRCDNATHACARWSGRQGTYVPDQPATQKLYGNRRGYRWQQR